MNKAALEAFERGEQNVVQLLSPSEDQLERMWHAADGLLHIGEHARAIDVINALVLLAGPRADYSIALGLAYQGLGQPEKTEHHFNRATQLVPAEARDCALKAVKIARGAA